MSSKAKWGYSEENGPSSWAKILGINVGDKQSPIDIPPPQSTFDPALKNLKFSYPDFKNLKVVNNGLTLLCSPDSGDDNTSVVSDGPLAHKYKLAQFHFHWGGSDDTGSEHTVDGQQYSAELHLVHWNTDLYGSASEALTSENGLTVFGIFLKPGKEDHSGLSNITANLPEIQRAGSSVILKEPFNPSCLLPDSLEYWSYPGSLTTPPLSESVTWVVFKNPIVVSSSQIAALRELQSEDGGKVCPNFRPTCSLNQRTVKASFQ